MEANRVDSPFVGLMPYSEEDARFFFGREREQRVITANLFAARLTILYGSSGVGKSSVLQAGVIRELRRMIEDSHKGGEPPDLGFLYFNDWQGNVLGRLQQAVVALQNGSTLGRDQAAKSEGSLAEVCGEVVNRLKRDILIIFDQFEEYFLYQGQHGGSNLFPQQFAEVANLPGLPVNILISIRDDALSKLDLFKPLIPNLFGNYLRLQHLGCEEAREAVVKSIATYNHLPREAKEYEQEIEIEPALVSAVIDQVRTGRVVIGDVGQGGIAKAANAGVETPFLQLVMSRLWNQELARGSVTLRQQTLTELGGAPAIVKNHLDGVMNSLSEEECGICARIFQFLVTPSGTKIALLISDLEEYAAVPKARLDMVLAKLSATKMRILAPVTTTTGERQEVRYEIYHDSLGQAILDWRRRYTEEQRRITQELQQKAERDRQQRELEQAQALAVAQRERAEAEQQRAEEQAHSAKRLRRLVVALALVSILVLGAAIYAWILRQESERRRLEVQAANSQILATKFNVEAYRADSAGSTDEAMRLWSQAEKHQHEAHILIPASQLARLTVKSEPGACVFVNEEPRAKVGDKGESKTIELIPGTYNIRVFKDDFMTQEHRTVLVPGNSSLELRLPRIHFAPEFSDSFLEGKKYWSAPESWQVEKGKMLVRGPGIGWIKDRIYQDFKASFDIQFVNRKGAVWILRAQDDRNYYLFQLLGPDGNPSNAIRTSRFKKGELELVNTIRVNQDLSRAGDWLTITIEAKGSHITHMMQVSSQPRESAQRLASLEDSNFPYGTIGFGTKDGEEFYLGPTTVIPYPRGAGISLEEPTESRRN
jgi:hypothetical protein